jgi:hypothetical protein
LDDDLRNGPVSISKLNWVVKCVIIWTPRAHFIRQRIDAPLPSNRRIILPCTVVQQSCSGSNFGTLTLGNAAAPDVILNGTGQALDLQTGTLAGGLLSLTTTSSATQGIRIQSVAGSYHFGPTAISGAITQGILITGSSALAPTFGVTTVSAGTDGVSIQNHSGVVTFNALSVTTLNGIGLLGANNSGKIVVTNNTGGINATGGAAISLSQASGTSAVDLNFSELIATNGSNGVILTNITGTIKGGVGGLNANGTVFSVNGGNVDVSYAGSLTHSTAGTYLVDIKNTTGGMIKLGGNLAASGNSQGILINATTGTSVEFSGASKILNTSTKPAVTLSSNGTSSILFSEGGLAITTTTATGVAVTGGAGSVEITGTGNIISSGTGTALNVTNTNIGANDITFQSISPNGGSDAGIILNNTGTSGKLVVTGVGNTDGSGGTIQNKTGVDLNYLTGCGIYLYNTSNVSLANMILTDFQNNGIRGALVSGFSLTNCDVTVSTFSTNGTTDTNDEGSISFGLRDTQINGLTGTALITNCLISNGYKDNLMVYNNSGILNLTIANSIIRHSGNPGSIVGNDGILVEALANANVSVSVHNCQFTGNAGYHFRTITADAGVLDVKFGTVAANTCTGGNPLATRQSILVTAGNQWSGTATVNISNNSIVQAKDSPINVTTDGTGTMKVTINANTIGESGVAVSGTVDTKDAIRLTANGDKSIFGVNAHGGTLTAAVTNNVIQQVSGRGIYASGRDGGSVSDPIELNLTITGNTFRQSTTASGQGIRVDCGTTPTPTADNVKVHANIGGIATLANTFTDDWGSTNLDGLDYDEIRVLHTIPGSQFILTDFAGNGALTSDVSNYLKARNSIGAAGTASANLTSPNTFTGGAPPPLP